MGDNWDDSDDEWDVDNDDELDARLGLKKLSTSDAAAESATPVFDDEEEEDLAVKEKQEMENQTQAALKKKGQNLAAKKKAEQERVEELEVARRAMELEEERKASMTEEERRELAKRMVEEADHALTDDLFGGVDAPPGSVGGVVPGGIGSGTATGTPMNAGDTVKMKDLKDHLKHARKVAQCLKGHGKIHLALAFLKECIEQSKSVLDEDGVSDLIRTLNVIKNEKVSASKRKVKGQAQKAGKRDKAAEAKAKQLQVELYGDSNQFDEYDEYGEAFEDSFF